MAVAVLLLLLTYFAVPPRSQRRVLLLGVMGAIVLRAITILIGAWLNRAVPLDTLCLPHAPGRARKVSAKKNGAREACVRRG